MKVQIVDIRNDEVVKEIEVQSERQAEKLERGMNINLDHENYFTRIV
jgi:hypothetical protein